KTTSARITPASPSNEIRLLTFIPHLRGALLFGLAFGMAGMCTSGDQLVPENLSLALVQLEDGAMRATVGVNIFQANCVVLLVGKETNNSAAAERSRRLAQSQR